MHKDIRLTSKICSIMNILLSSQSQTLAASTPSIHADFKFISPRWPAAHENGSTNLHSLAFSRTTASAPFPSPLGISKI